MRAETRREDRVETRFGVEIRDPYRWLEDASAAEVRSWMHAENEAAHRALDALPERDAIAARLHPLLYVDDLSAPVRRGSRWFFERRAADREKAIVYWQEGKKGEPKVLLDPHQLSADGSISLGVWVPSWDGKWVAHALREKNADEATLYVREVATGKISLTDVIEGAKYATPSWTPDGSGFFYTWLPTDPALPVADRPGRAEIRFHRLGVDPKNDEVVYPSLGDPTKFIGAALSRDGRYLFLYVWRSWSENDVYVRFEDPVGRKRGFVPLAAGRPARFDVHAHQGRFYVVTNEGAPRWRIFSVDPRRLDTKDWQLIVPEDPEAVLDGVTVVGGHLGLSYLHRAASVLRVHTLAGKRVRELALPAIGTASGFVGLPEDDEAYFSFSSFTYAPEIWSTSVKQGTVSRYARVDVPIEPERYEVEQVSYPSKDGTPISMFIVKAKGLVKTGDHPTWLYGYGGFSLSLTPEFKAKLYPWLDRGGVYAVPNLRGGGEYGEAWHHAGMGPRKQNAFDDFIAAAEWLIKEKYTRPDRLVISGRSNGGLLVGAAMVQRPELFGAVVAGVPLLDMLRYHLFGSGKTWISEYGDPEVEADFRVLASYSPYHHVREGVPYPPLLMLSADSDDRVDPMHARKFVARVRSASSGLGPYLLRIESQAGHGGADLRKSALEQATDELAFMLSVVMKD